MNKQLLVIAAMLVAMLFFSSCESCVQKTAKKVTDLSMSALEGVSESIAEHGEATSEKLTDALGAVVKGAGKSVDRQLNEHATHVASVTGRTFVQALDGFEGGLLTEYYDVVPHEDNFPSGIVLQQFGKIKDTPVLDAYFIIIEPGDYACTFDFVDTKGKVLLSRNATIDKKNTEKKISVVSIALNTEEEELFGKSAITQIKVTKK